jgi:hypothetical protein
MRKMMVNVCSLKGAEMESTNGSIYSSRVAMGRTSYFMDVRRAVNGRFYLTLTESRRVSDKGFDQSRVFLFEEGVGPFREALEGALSAMENAATDRGEPPSDGETPGRRGSRWTVDEDDTLRRSFSEGASLEEIAGKLDRSRRAVELRLEKLGLAVAETAGAPQTPR